MARKEIPERIKTVSDWIIEGLSQSDIIEALLSEENPPKKPTEIIDLAKKYICELSGQGKFRIAFHLEARRELYRKSVEISDYKAAFSILQDIARIENIYEEKSETNWMDEVLSDVG